MMTLHKLTHFLLPTLFLLVASASVVCAADPGIPYSMDGVGHDQKPGSLLIYSFQEKEISRER